MLKLVQAFSRRIHVKGMPRMLWAARGAFQRTDNTYDVYNGLRLKIDPNTNFHWLNVVNYGGFEDVLLFERLLRPGGVCVDIGANYGYMSINASKIVGPSGMVVAVEPEPRALELLEHNIGLNNAGVITVPRALSDHCGTASFNLATETGLSRLDNPGRDDFGMVRTEVITVETTTLDSLLEEIAPGRAIDLVKMDVEGAELQVLRGAETLLDRRRTHFILEINHGHLDHNNLSFTDVWAFFTSRGYDVYWIQSYGGALVHFGDRLRLEFVHEPKSYVGKYADMLASPSGASCPP
jgi:FkbM family methyltransferase